MKQTHRPPRSIYPAQNRHMRRRTRVLAGLVAVLCFGGLLARLFTLQMLDPSGYANRAAAQQLRDTTLPAARGEIYSADGVTLAASKTCWTIRASPRELADELVQPAAKALSEILDIDYDATLQKLSKRTSNDCLLSRRVCPATQLSSARNSACGSSSPRRSLRKASTATSVSVTRSILPLCLTACVFSHWRRMMSPLSRTTSTTSCKNRAVSMKRYPKTGPLPGRGARQLRGQGARRPSRPETRPPSGMAHATAARARADARPCPN